MFREWGHAAHPAQELIHIGDGDKCGSPHGFREDVSEVHHHAQGTCSVDALELFEIVLEPHFHGGDHVWAFALLE